MISLGDMTDRPPRALADGEELVLGPNKRMRWLDAPHLPHNWECGYMFESSTRTLLCGDLFTQRRRRRPAADGVGGADVVGGDAPGDAGERRDRRAHAREILNKLAATEPRTLALMHGSSYRGDGAKLLRAFGDALGV